MDFHHGNNFLIPRPSNYLQQQNVEVFFMIIIFFYPKRISLKLF